MSIRPNASYDALMALARSRPDGFKPQDVYPELMPQSTAMNSIAKGIKAGTLFRAKWPPTGIRLFTNKEQAEQHQAEMLKTPQYTSPIALQLFELAKRASGFVSTDVPGERRQVSVMTQRWLKRGRLHGVKVAARHVIYFGKKEWADAAREAVQKGGMRRPSRKSRAASPDGEAPAITVRGRAPWRDSDPAVYPTDKHGNPLYKVTIAKGMPDPTRSNTFV